MIFIHYLAFWNNDCSRFQGKLFYWLVSHLRYRRNNSLDLGHTWGLGAIIKWLASPQTYFGVRLFVCHTFISFVTRSFLPHVRGGEMNAWQTNKRTPKDVCGEAIKWRNSKDWRDTEQYPHHNTKANQHCCFHDNHRRPKLTWREKVAM